MTRYLAVSDLMLLNNRMTEKWGGLAGIRDSALLESALARPQTGYYQDLIEEASALCESLLQNLPFLDGNKRSAIVATAVFLRWNGYKLKFADREMYDWLMSVYDEGRVKKSVLEVWLRDHCVETL